MPESQDHPCRNYSMLPVRGFGLAVDISALEKDCPGDEQIAHAAMPSSVAVAIPLDVEPGSDLADARTVFVAPADGYVSATAHRAANVASVVSTVGIQLLDANDKEVIGQNAFLSVYGFQSVHLPVRKGANVLVKFQFIESGSIRFVYCNGTMPK